MYTPVRRAAFSATNEMAYQTPPISFSKELKQVLFERNLLTAKTRKKLGSMLDSSRLSQATPEVDKRRNFRLQAIEEIVSSEKAYLQQLETLMQYFVQPLKQQAVISDASHTALFGQIEMIYNLNGELLRELESNMEHVAQAFLKMAPFFKLYSVYAFDYRNALLIVQDLTSKNPVFRKFLEQNESRPEVQRKLNSLMIVPIQRVPRYRLLLEQVLLYTSPADADFKLLKESVRQIESTVSHINSCIEDQEVTQLLIHLQNSLLNRAPNIVKPSRKVIREGILHKVARNGNEIKRYCVLMSDIFMYCKVLKERTPNTVVENSLECCCIFPLKKCKVYEMFPGTFKLTCQGDGIIFCTSDMQLGRIWVAFLRDAIDLHIQCRKTLRKESSKRTPIRKKDIKNFESDYVLSPKKKCDFETIFRNKNRSTDSEDEDKHGAVTTSCFPRNKSALASPYLPTKNTENISNVKSRKRPAPLPPIISEKSPTSNRPTASAKRISKLYKLIARDKTPGGILKHTSAAVGVTVPKRNSNSSEHDPTYGFASRYSDSKSYFRAHNVDNTIPTTVTREDLFSESLGDGNFCDVLFPLRSSGGSNKSATANDGAASTWTVPRTLLADKENHDWQTPPQRKRVKFNDTKDVCNAETTSDWNLNNAHNALKPQPISSKIYEFFANLF